MPLTVEQQQLVTLSFAQIVPITHQATELFYQRLWEIAPETRAMFKSTDMETQGMKLMQTLGVAVRALHDLSGIDLFLYDLGQRHISYGVNKAQFALVKVALLWMLEQCLEDEFTPNMRDAWDAAYDLIADSTLRAFQSPD